MTSGWLLKKLNSAHASGGHGQLGVDGNWKMIPAREIISSWCLTGWQAGRMGRVGRELDWNPPTTGPSPRSALAFDLVPNRRLTKPSEADLTLQGLAHNSPLLNPSGIVQTEQSLLPPGSWNSAVVVFVILYCNSPRAPGREVHGDRGRVIAPFAAAPASPQGLSTCQGTEKHGSACLLVVVRGVLRNWGLAAHQGPLNLGLQGCDLLGNNSIPHFPEMVLVIHRQRAQARL